MMFGYNKLSLIRLLWLILLGFLNCSPGIYSQLNLTNLSEYTELNGVVSEAMIVPVNSYEK